MQNTSIGAAIALFLVSLPAIVSAAEQEPIVIEDLSLRELRAEVEKNQNEIYRVFNSLNEDDEYDIICHSYVPTGSNISREACCKSAWKNWIDIRLFCWRLLSYAMIG